MTPASRAHAFTVRLKHRSGEIVLGIGTHVIGRHRSCDVMLDSSHVSRRHARVHVSRQGMLVEDLQSANGVYVNGNRVLTEPVRLRNGDRLVLGQEELEVVVEAPSRPVSDKMLILKPPDFAQKNDDEDQISSEFSGPGTRTADFFALVSKIVDRALAENRVDDAATMLTSQMGKMMLDARAGRP